MRRHDKEAVVPVGHRSGASVFDTVVAMTAGRSHHRLCGVTPESVAALVDGTIYTRGPRKSSIPRSSLERQHDRRRGLVQGGQEALFCEFPCVRDVGQQWLQHHAAAGVALLAKLSRSQAKKRSCLPARVRRHARCAMLHIEGASRITSRAKQRAMPRARPSMIVSALPDAYRGLRQCSPRGGGQGRQVVFAAGAIGVRCSMKRTGRMTDD